MVHDTLNKQDTDFTCLQPSYHGDSLVHNMPFLEKSMEPSALPKPWGPGVSHPQTNC